MKNSLTNLLFLLIASNPIITSQDLIANCQNDLIEASKTGEIEKIKESIESGASINHPDTCDFFTPLMHASFRNHLQAVQELIKYGANVDKSNKIGITPLITTSLQGYLKIVQELIKAGANVDKSSQSGKTPLSMACEFRNLDIVQELIKAGANVNHTDINDDTPLNHALRRNSLEIVQELVKAGAIINKLWLTMDINIRNFLKRIQYIEENINKITLDLSKDEKIILAKRLINQHKVNLYPLVCEILKSLTTDQLKQFFEQREIINLIKDYKNRNNNYSGYTKNIIELIKRYTLNNPFIEKLEKEQQKLARSREAFTDIYINTQE